MVRVLTQMSGRVVVDLAAHPSPASRCVVELANDIHLVVEPSESALYACRGALALLKKWGSRAERLGLVLVDRDGASGSAPDRQRLVSEVASRLGCAVRGTIPRASVSELIGSSIDFSNATNDRSPEFWKSIADFAEALDSLKPS